MLDTNVVGEVTRTQPAGSVLAWFDRFAPVAVVPVIVLEEVLFGVRIIAAEERREVLNERLMLLWERLDHRFAIYDAEAARRCAAVRATARAQGVAISERDAQIAATAIAARTPLATRDAVFGRLDGLRPINPWTDA